MSDVQRLLKTNKTARTMLMPYCIYIIVIINDKSILCMNMEIKHYKNKNRSME